MTSFNYGGKKASDVGLTYRCLIDVIWGILCLIVSSTIVRDGGWLNLFAFFSLFVCFLLLLLFFLRGGNRCLPWDRRWIQSSHYNTSELGETLSYNWLKQMGSIIFQFWSMSKDSRIWILLRGSSVRVCLVVLNQGCCGSGQYNLPDRILRLDANTTLN